MNVLLIGTGEIDLGPLVGPGPYDVRRYEKADDRRAIGAERFDRAVLLGFSDALPRPGLLLRDVADMLAGDGHLVIDVQRIARPAVRAALFKGSDGETTAPTVTDEDVALYANRSVQSLLEEAGLHVVNANLTGSVLEARPTTAGNGRVKIPSEPSDAERLAYARKELEELRAFFTTMHDGQRRLHEEAARLRSQLAIRERDLRDARAEIDALRARPTQEAALNERLAHERDLSDGLRAEIDDLKGRLDRLRTALAELRER